MKRKATKSRTMLIAAGVVVFVSLGIYLGVTQGVEPGLPHCSKYTLICRP